MLPCHGNVTGSIPVLSAKWVKRVVTTGMISSTTLLSGSSSFGRAIAFQAIGGQFEPGLPLKVDKMCSNHRKGTFHYTPAEVAHSVEHNLAKVGVASSSLVFRSSGY